MSRPKFGFSNYSDNPLADKGQRIHDLMVTNVQFPAPPVPYTMLQTLITNFKNAITAAMGRDELKVSAKREAKIALIHALKLNAGYIMSITDNVYDIEQTGYDPVMPSSPVGIPAVPVDVEGKSAGTQAVEISWVHSRGANNYVVAVTDAANPLSPSATWVVKAYPTASRVVLNEGLNPLTYYWVTVRSNGAEGLSDASAPIRVLSI